MPMGTPPHQRPPRPKAAWSAIHLDELERNFPEQATLTSAEELQFRAGQRSVVQFVRSRLNTGDTG